MLPKSNKLRTFIEANSQQPTANSQQPTANSQQPTQINTIFVLKKLRSKKILVGLF